MDLVRFLWNLSRQPSCVEMPQWLPDFDARSFIGTASARQRHGKNPVASTLALRAVLLLLELPPRQPRILGTQIAPQNFH